MGEEDTKCLHQLSRHDCDLNEIGAAQQYFSDDQDMNWVMRKHIR